MKYERLTLNSSLSQDRKSSTDTSAAASAWQPAASMPSEVQALRKRVPGSRIRTSTTLNPRQARSVSARRSSNASRSNSALMSQMLSRICRSFCWRFRFSSS